MLTEDRINTNTSETPMFFNPGPLDSWKGIDIFSKTWRYRWEGRKVEIEGPDRELYTVPSWVVLEISEADYREWEKDPFDQPKVMAKDVDDYIRERIMRSAQARKAGAGIRKFA